MTRKQGKKKRLGQQRASANDAPRRLEVEAPGPVASSWKTRLGVWLEDKLERLARSS